MKPIAVAVIAGLIALLSGCAQIPRCYAIHDKIEDDCWTGRGAAFGPCKNAGVSSWKKDAEAMIPELSAELGYADATPLEVIPCP